MGLQTPRVTIHESSSRVHEGFSVQVLRSALDFTCRARRRDNSGFRVEVQTWILRGNIEFRLIRGRTVFFAWSRVGDTGFSVLG